MGPESPENYHVVRYFGQAAPLEHDFATFLASKSSPNRRTNVQAHSRLGSRALDAPCQFFSRLHRFHASSWRSASCVGDSHVRANHGPPEINLTGRSTAWMAHRHLQLRLLFAGQAVVLEKVAVAGPVYRRAGVPTPTTCNLRLPASKGTRTPPEPAQAVSCRHSWTSKLDQSVLVNIA